MATVQPAQKSAAAFVRLCVETNLPKPKVPAKEAAAFVRLCVETALWLCRGMIGFRSRLRAAVC